MTKKLLALMALIGCVQFGAYRIAVSVASEGPTVASPQPDTYLYCQAARRVAEGHPFSYSAGEPVSTGTTSVLYPFVLAVPYALGFKGPSLLTAGFFLNGFFYLVFLLGWGVALSRWVGVGRPDGTARRFVAGALLALSAQPAICAFGQTDTGIWMATSAVLAALLSVGRDRTACAVALLAPAVRPEGAVVALASLMVAALLRGWCTDGESRRTAKRLAGLGLCGLVGLGLVFALNWCLVGRAQFDSVGFKGHFKTYPFAEAVVWCAADALQIMKGFLMGIGTHPIREMFMLPLLGGLIFWTGVASRDWRPDRRTAGFSVFVLASLGAFALIASSGWLGTNFDRYLAWTSPVLAILTAEGAVALAGWQPLARVRWLPAGLVLGYALVMSGVFVCHLMQLTERGRSRDEFYRACDAAMKPGASVGGMPCASAYAFSDRRFVHLAGIYSPSFFGHHLEANWVEDLKHEKGKRFDYWMFLADESAFVPQEARDAVWGECVLFGPSRHELRQADWSAFDAAAEVPVAPVDWPIRARVDVGYLPDERAADYEVVDRWGQRVGDPFATVRPLPDGRLAVEGGRAFQGGDLMTVDLEPGRDCLVTMRTVANQDGKTYNADLRMRLEVDGEAAGWADCRIDPQTNAFQDVSWTIPGGAIKSRPSRVAFLGDHAPCAYWFRQADAASSGKGNDR